MSQSITEGLLSQLPKEYVDAVESIQKRLPVELSKPDWGIICGSGLSGLGDHIVDKITIDYDTIPVSEMIS
jgi:purine-nucleoside phosphorylase